MKIIIFAPHPDDEIIGVGGTIAKRTSMGDDVYVCVVTKGYEPLFSAEFIDRGRRECLEADKLLGVKNTIFLDFPSTMLDTIPMYEINEKILGIVNEIKPDEVYIPHKGDMHIDHRIVAESVMVAVRPRGDYYPKRVYAYETLSETGWNMPSVDNEFIPTMYVDITVFLDKKLRAMQKYRSQLQDFPNTRSLKAIESLSYFRGSTVSVKSAEAFSLIREVK